MDNLGWNNFFSKGFDESNIFSGPPVHIRKKFSYTGHATTAYSVEQAAEIVDYIGQKTGCDDCLPFAVRLVEGEELICIAEDNGEFGCGDILSSCLRKVDGFNCMVCVSMKVQGMFVTDMVQGQKHHAVKQAASKAIEILRQHLTAYSKEGDPSVAVDANIIIHNLSNIGNNMKDDAIDVQLPSINRPGNTQSPTATTEINALTTATFDGIFSEHTNVPSMRDHFPDIIDGSLKIDTSSRRLSNKTDTDEFYSDELNLYSYSPTPLSRAKK